MPGGEFKPLRILACLQRRWQGEIVGRLMLKWNDQIFWWVLRVVMFWPFSLMFFSLGLGRFREFPLAGHIGSSTYEHFRKVTTIHESIIVGRSGDIPRCKGLTHQLWNPKKSSTNLQKDSLLIGNFQIDMNFSFSRQYWKSCPPFFSAPFLGHLLPPSFGVREGHH